MILGRRCRHAYSMGDNSLNLAKPLFLRLMVYVLAWKYNKIVLPQKHNQFGHIGYRFGKRHGVLKGTDIRLLF